MQESEQKLTEEERGRLINEQLDKVRPRIEARALLTDSNHPYRSKVDLEKLRQAVADIEKLAARGGIQCPDILVDMEGDCCSAAYKRVYISNRQIQTDDPQFIGQSLAHEVAHIINNDILKNPGHDTTLSSNEKFKIYRQQELAADHLGAELTGRPDIAIKKFIDSARKAVQKVKRVQSARTLKDRLEEEFDGGLSHPSLRERIHALREMTKEKPLTK